MTALRQRLRAFQPLVAWDAPCYEDKARDESLESLRGEHDEISREMTKRLAEPEETGELCYLQRQGVKAHDSCAQGLSTS